MRKFLYLYNARCCSPSHTEKLMMKSMNDLQNSQPGWKTRMLEIFCIMCTISVLTIILVVFPVITHSLLHREGDSQVNSSEAEEIMPPPSGVCSENFYISAYNICLPLCHEWQQFDSFVSTAKRITGGVCAAIGLVVGIIVLLSALIQYKKMFTLPSVFIVYMALISIILAFFALLSVLFGTSLYCSSDDLFETISTASAYCMLSGAVYHYCFILLSFLILCHIGVVFYKVAFPFHALEMSKLKRLKYLHIVLILVGIVLPLPGVLTVLLLPGQQYNMNVFPPLFCVPQDPEVSFYSFVLINDVLTLTYISLLIVIIVIVHKHNNLFKLKTPRKYLSWLIQLSGTEKKLIFLFFVYFSIGVSTNSYSIAQMFDQNNVIESLTAYFICEALYIGYNTTCEAEKNEATKYSHIDLEILAWSFLVLFPLGQLIFVINFNKLKNKIQKAWNTASQYPK